MFKFLYNFFMPSSIRNEASTPHARTIEESRLMEVCTAPAVQALQIMSSSEQGLGAEEASRGWRSMAPTRYPMPGA